MSVLLITHDLGVVAENAQHVVVMYAGRIVESAPVAQLFARPMHPYTRGLLESVPLPPVRVARAHGSPSRSSAPPPARRRLRAIEGMVPDLRRLGEGCRFADRCSWCVRQCQEQEPSLDLVAPERLSRCWRAAEVAPPEPLLAEARV